MKKATATSHGNKRVLAAAGAGSSIDGMDASRELTRKVNPRKQESAIPHRARNFDALTLAENAMQMRFVCVEGAGAFRPLKEEIGDPGL
jgi:hypothetical protein